MNFREATELLKEKKSLTKEQSYILFKKLALEDFDEAEVEEFLKALKEKGETWEEISGAVKAYREVMKPFEHGLSESAIIVDTCGTGGDAKHTFNFSTAVALALSVEEDVFVVKHGNRSISSKSGSADLIEALGIPLDLPEEALREALQKVRFVFLFAPLYHSAFARVAPIRKRLGRTIFNLLGPLLNPARPNHQLLGVYDFKLTEKIAYVLDDLGVKRAMVVWGEEGYDEITITGSTKVSELEKGRITTYYLDPEDFGFERCVNEEELKVKDSKESLEIFYRLFENSLEGPIKDMFLLNLAGALYVCGKSIDFKGALKRARKYLEEKIFLKQLEKILDFYSRKRH
ncbi:anthranilate phosphoribosyltransferase [Caldimicrobium thiodismutans]|uniref:Anthranilate phosphoribosyltransferase n=1 Tax=Caldimicrobium thiodismutans TaxID=1653476 RepID=A0A0U5AVW3_9BACT|nr:anthranilate phosphoribosyltransferase [Caldimicrobium thiodismutans]BAU22686.1 anthranilate phosphoribosyltransferase [Caldimicrobium thiodismutans]